MTDLTPWTCAVCGQRYVVPGWRGIVRCDVASNPRSTTIRDRDRAAIRRTKPPCGICEGEIDYTLPHTDPKSYVVDHIIPLNRGGLDELENKQAAHRDCNRAKSDKLAEDNAPRAFVTPRSW